MAEIVKKRKSETNDRVIESEVFDASRKARTIVLDAETKAQKIIEDAKTQAISIREQAQQEGHAQGVQEGLGQYQETILRLNHDHQDFLSSAEEQLVELAVGISQKVLHQELKTHRQTIVQIVREALVPMNRKRDIVIYVNPMDKEILENKRPQVMEIMMGNGHIQFIAEPDISMGGCLIETEHGSVDARLETQLSVIIKALTGKAEHIELPEIEPERTEAPVAAPHVEVQEAISEDISEAIPENIQQVMDQVAEVKPEPPKKTVTYSSEPSPPRQVSKESPENAPENTPEKAAAKPDQTDEMMAELDRLADRIESTDDINELLSALDKDI